MEFDVKKAYPAREGGSYLVLRQGGTAKDGSRIYFVREPGGSHRFMPASELETRVHVGRIPGHVYISPTQLKMFERCKRKWAFRYIDKIPEPPRPATTFGTEGHAVIETYLRTGVFKGPADAVEAAKQGQTHWPAANDDALIETKFEWRLRELKAVMTGFADLVIVPTETSPLVVIDHKFTKDLRYSLKPDELKDDLQAVVYMKYFMTNYIVTEGIARWLYYCARPKSGTKDGRPRTPRGFKAVEHAFDVDHMDLIWSGVEMLAGEMVELKTKKVPAKDVESNPFACGDYGGCPYAAHCSQRHTKTLGQLLSGARVAHLPKSKSNEGRKNMPTLSDVIKQRQQAKNDTPINPPDAPSPAPGKADTPEPKPVTAKKKRTRRTKAQIHADKAFEAAATDEERKAAKMLQDEAYGRAVVAEEERPEPKEVMPPPVDKPRAQTLLEGMLVVMVDTFPLKGSFTTKTLAEYLTDAKEYIAESNGVSYWNTLEYRQGEELLAAACQKKLKEDTPALVLLCDSRSSEWKSCGSVLTEAADLVVRGG